MERRRHPDIGPDMYNPAHEIPAAAHLLCDNGISTNVGGAIFSYNHDWSYVDTVLAKAREYGR
jgi:hypothetical protein